MQQCPLGSVWCSTASWSPTRAAPATSIGSAGGRDATSRIIDVRRVLLLWADDESLMDAAYDRRRARLADLDLQGALVVVRSWDGMTAPWLFAGCEEYGVEGIVLKRRTSTYRPGERSQDWRKLKTRHWFEKHAEHGRLR
jgi:hypothetical protein